MLFTVFKHEFRTVFLSLFFSSFTAFTVSFLYLEEFFFLLFLPYFSITDANSILVSSFQSLLRLQVIPIFFITFFSLLVSIVTIFRFLTISIKRTSKQRTCLDGPFFLLASFLLLRVLVFFLFHLFLNFFYHLLPSHHYAYFFLLDITVDSWLNSLFLIFALILLVVSLSFYLFRYLIVFENYVSMKTRLIPAVLLLLALFFLPPDPIVHGIFIFLMLFCLEFLVFLNSLRSVYLNKL